LVRAQREEKDQRDDSKGILKMLCIVIPVKSCLALTKATIKSISTKQLYQIIVIDDYSNEQTKSWLKENVDVVITDPSGVPGVAHSWNLGIKKAFNLGFDHVLICNNDIVFHSETIDKLVERIKKDDVVLVTATNVSLSTTTSKNTFENVEKMQTSKSFPEGEKGTPDFSCFMISKRTIELIGWFDENFERAYFEDNDYYARIIVKGFKAVCLNDAIFWHHGSQTLKSDPTLQKEIAVHYRKNEAYFVSKWGCLPVKDPNEMKKKYNLKQLHIQGCNT
jgi:GT2 family glycosyltransferase